FACSRDFFRWYYVFFTGLCRGKWQVEGYPSSSSGESNSLQMNELSKKPSHEADDLEETDDDDKSPRKGSRLGSSGKDIQENGKKEGEKSNDMESSDENEEDSEKDDEIKY